VYRYLSVIPAINVSLDAGTRELAVEFGLTTGAEAVTVNSIALEGVATDYAVMSWTGGEIDSGTTQAVKVRFRPSSTAAFSARVVIAGNQSNNPTVIPVSGGAPPQGAMTTASHH
jgi:hypothetical protein